MSDTTLNRFLASGTQAQRLAFTPNPATPASGPDPLCFWDETDTGHAYMSASGGAWVRIGDVLPWKLACRAATTGALAANTYNNGASGVGATLTANANAALAAQDGVTLVAGDRLLVKNEATGANNGIYVLTQVGDGSHPYILTRDMDADASVKLVNATTTISEGSTLADQTWQCTTNATITVGTTSQTWAQSGGGGGATGANPTATASDVAVNGSAATFMRSDGAPAIQKASSSQFGLVKVDGTTITAAAGVITAVTSAGGLFSQVMSATPTQASTGLSNLVGTGAASSNTSTGQRLVGSSGQAGAYATSAPGTPYSFVALLAGNNANSLPAIGWTDGTKYQFMYVNPGTIPSSFGQINVQNNSTLSAFVATAATGGNNYDLRLTWFKIRDDGTNVTYSVAVDGANFVTVYTVAKASGYLGASGYTHPFVATMGGAATANDVTVMSWTQGS